MLSESIVSTTPPSFTTPSLDFQSHSQELQTLVASLYRFRDSFWVTHSFFPPATSISSQLQAIQDASLQDVVAADKMRRKMLLENVETAIRRFNLLTKPPSKRKKPQDPADQRPASPISANTEAIRTESAHTFDPTLSDTQHAVYLYLRGKLYNILPVYHHVAEQNLQKAVRLDPLFVDAWNSLAECLWKKGDLKKARLCYDKSLEIVSLFIMPVCWINTRFQPSSKRTLKRSMMFRCCCDRLATVHSL
jgi:tetratricopeptide (TPR) repeat protein